MQFKWEEFLFSSTKYIAHFEMHFSHSFLLYVLRFPSPTLQEKQACKCGRPETPPQTITLVIVHVDDGTCKCVCASVMYAKGISHERFICPQTIACGSRIIVASCPVPDGKSMPGCDLISWREEKFSLDGSKHTNPHTHKHTHPGKENHNHRNAETRTRTRRNDLEREIVFQIYNLAKWATWNEFWNVFSSTSSHTHFGWFGLWATGRGFALPPPTNSTWWFREVGWGLKDKVQCRLLSEICNCWGCLFLTRCSIVCSSGTRYGWMGKSGIVGEGGNSWQSLTELWTIWHWPIVFRRRLG